MRISYTNKVQKLLIFLFYLKSYCLISSFLIKGDIFSIFVIAIAAAEAAIGLAIVSSIHRCTQCVRACPTDVLEMIPWDGCKAKQIASAPRTEDCVGCKRCESACPTDFLSVRVYLGPETTRSMALAY
ncbi:hypothetical protein LUZ63_024078 [Rhynchospora breviuscula]|uniref:Photosystem I iron-sulfur center n=1 Tax=Rhynchospora breviuscula TaxID=2022672 RepID=A0A9Q0BWC4_9POAL|nr:hypothetical protein LUZ63_024078 [Rhynchospora breviuscula]